MDRAEFAVSARMRCRQTPERAREVARTGCARDRGREGALSLGDFSLGKQREGTGPQGCGTNPQGCESVFAKAEKPEQKLDDQPCGLLKSASSLRWNDEGENNTISTQPSP